MWKMKSRNSKHAATPGHCGTGRMVIHPPVNWRAVPCELLVYTLPCQISAWYVYTVAPLRMAEKQPKHRDLGQIFKSGISCTHPFPRWRHNLACKSWHKMYYAVPYFILIGIYCCPYCAKNCKFDNFSSYRSFCTLPFSDQGQIWHARVDLCQIAFQFVYCVSQI